MIDVCVKHSLRPKNCLREIEGIVNLVDNIEGSIVECGVWKGGISMWMAYCQNKCSQERDIYLYDTFDGMTEPDVVKDSRRAVDTYTKIKSGKISRGYDMWHKQNKWAYAPLDIVIENMNCVKYDKGEVYYIIGDVVKTLTQIAPEKIAILRLDTDFYESTKKELEVLFSRLSVGGYLMVDDYSCWEGSTTATDEFLKENGDKVETYSKRFGIILKKIKK